MGRFVQLPIISGGSNIKNGGNDNHTLLMLHGEDFTDSSSNNRSIVNVGNVMIDDGKFDRGFYFTREKRLITNMATDDAMQLNNKDFTIDFWCYIRDNTSTNCIITYTGQTYTPLGLSLETINGLRLSVGNIQNTGYEIDIPTKVQPIYHKWYHYAIVRKGTRLMLFMNGILIAEANINNYSIVNASSLIIAHYAQAGGPTYGINGSIDELRISDVARWDKDFYPSIEPYK